MADDFWPLFVRDERGLGDSDQPAWVALRKGRERPLSTPRSSRSRGP